MFGFGKKNKKQKNLNKTAGSNKTGSVGKGKGQRSSEEIRAEALANVRAAKENLGEDTIRKITESMNKMEQQSAAMAAAKKKLAEEADAEIVRDEILSMLETKH